MSLRTAYFLVLNDWLRLVSLGADRSVLHGYRDWLDVVGERIR